MQNYQSSTLLFSGGKIINSEPCYFQVVPVVGPLFVHPACAEHFKILPGLRLFPKLYELFTTPGMVCSRTMTKPGRTSSIKAWH